MNDYEDQDQGHEPAEREAEVENTAAIDSTLQVGRCRWSGPSTPKLDAALAAAQGEMRNAEQNRENTHLRSRYADLGSVIIAVREALSAHGIARYQIPWTGHDRKLYITTRFACGGEWVEADFQVPFEQLKGLRQIQSVGNAITYVKRYALTSMAGIAAGEDDDGEGNGDHHRDQPQQQPRDPMTRWAAACRAFAALDVQPPTLLAVCRKANPNALDDDDHDKLQRLCAALRKGDPKAHETIDRARASMSDG